jgi:transposase
MEGMAAISLDLRKRIMRALDSDPSSLRVAARFDVSASFVRKLRIQARQTGDLSARRGSGKKRLVKGEQEETLRELVRKHPDATLIDLAKLLKKAARVVVSETTMWRSLQRLGITLKKRSSTRSNAIARK